MLSKKDLRREYAADNRATKDWAASKAQYKKDKQNAKATYKSNIKKMKNSAQYKRHKQNLKTIGKAYLKTTLQNIGIGAIGAGATVALIAKGKAGAAMAVANAAGVLGYANTARNVVKTYKQLKKKK